MQIRIQSSQKKKLVEETHNFREIQMKFLDKDSSRQYSEVMEQIMRTNLRKESARSLHRKQSSSKIQQRQSQIIKQKSIIEPSVKQFKTEIKSQERVIQQPMRKVPYKFSFKSWIIELTIAYSVTFAILYLIKLSNFPYFQIILTIAFTASINPWRLSNSLILIAIPIIFANYFLNLSYFTYPSIIICYYAVMSFNERYKSKQIFVLTLLITIIFGLAVLPAIYKSLQIKIAYFYIFPLIMFMIRMGLSCCYWAIGHTASIFLQLPLFITGLEYGTILTRDTSTIEFWYLMVFFSLQIINDRTQFFLRILVKIANFCSKYRKQQMKELQPIHHPILPAHSNGHACINSFHLFLVVYIYCQLNLYTAPYTPDQPFYLYVNPWYKPLIVWLLSSVYEIMSLILQKRSKHKILFGYTSNKWWRSILRGFMLSLGMWLFYIGLGVGVLITQNI